MRSADPRVVGQIHRILHRAGEPVTRERLVIALANTPGLGCRWSRATFARRIREAINELVARGVPVVSDGRGFRIAKDRAELEAGLIRKQKAALTMLREVAAALRIPLSQVLRQLDLFEAAS